MRIGDFLSSEDCAPRELVSEDDTAAAITCGPGINRHIEAIQRNADAGFDELYVQQVESAARDDRFFEIYAEEILPRFRHGDNDGGTGGGSSVLVTER